MKIRTAAALVGVGALGGTASADIVQNAGQFDRSISVFDPIGQTFTAVDAEVGKIAFAFSDINPGFPNEPVTTTVYTGVGFGGAVLGSVTQTLPAVLPSTSAAPEFIDFDFGVLTLSVGAVYTVAVTVPSSPKVAVVYSDANPYAGGTYVDVGGVNAGWDLNFRVQAVPAPAGGALLLAGTLGAARRRR